jgi:hypothetical protein
VVLAGPSVRAMRNLAAFVLIAVLAGVAATPATAEPWPSWGRDISNSRFTPSTGGIERGNVVLLAFGLS